MMKITNPGSCRVSIHRSNHRQVDDYELDDEEEERINTEIHLDLRRMRAPQMFGESSSWISKFMNRKRFHFFKIIIPDIIQQKRMGLPRKFIRKFGKELSEVVVLTDPNGTKWHVELKEIEGEMWFVDGWQEFVDYYSIGDGHFLVFGYDRSSCFHVLIFDKSASEIVYPCHRKDFEEPNQENEGQTPANESDSVESLLASTPGPIRAESVKGVSNESDPHRASTIRHLKLEVKCEAPSEEGSDSVEIMDVSPHGPIRAELVKEVSNESDPHRASTIRHMKLEVKCEAPSEEGSDSVKIMDVSPKRQKRTDFMKGAIDESEVLQIFKLRCQIPRSRLRYSLRSFERKATRPNSEPPSRCTTHVKYTPKSDRNSTKNPEAFSPYQVSQSTESGGCGSPLKEESSDHIPFNRSSYSTAFLRKWPVTALMSRVDRDLKSSKPSFLVTMRPSYVNEPYMLNVPSNFAKEHFKQDFFLSLRVSDGRSWQVRCSYVDSNAKMHWGWRKFSEENHLKEGDVCMFELVNRHKVEMNVVIYRATS